MFSINRGAILLAAILFCALFLLKTDAATLPACTDPATLTIGCTAPIGSLPCVSDYSAGVFYPEDFCGTISFSPGNPIATGTTGGVGFTVNTLNVQCTANSGPPPTGCALVVIYVPPGTTTNYNGNGNLNSLPQCSSLSNPYTTAACIAASITTSQGAAQEQSTGTVSASGPLPSTLPAGTYTFQAYYEDTGLLNPQTVAPSVGTIDPIWAGTANLIVSYASTIAIVIPQPAEIIPGAASNVSVTVTGLSSTTTECMFYDGVFVNIMAAPSGSSTPPPCPPSYYDSSTASPTEPPCPYIITSSCSIETGYVEESPPTCTAASPTSASWTMYSAFPGRVSSGTYNYCIYYSAQAQEQSAGSPIGSAVITVNTFSSGYGLLITPTTFLLGNTTTISTQATSDYRTSSTVAPNICGTGDTGDNCYVEYAGQEPSATCEAPEYYTAVGITAVLHTISTCTLPLTQGSAPCILDSYPNNYQNRDNLTYSQLLSTQYLTNGDYLLCMYDYTPLDWVTNPYTITEFAPFFATATVSCVNGLCTTSSSAQAYVPPTCTVPPGVTCPCGICTTLGVVTPYGQGAQSLGAFGSTVCTIYSELDIILLIFAMILLLLGAALYAGSSILPAAVRGQAQSYAFGFILVGIIAMVIAALSVWALSISADTSIAQVLSYCTAFTS